MDTVGEFLSEAGRPELGRTGACREDESAVADEFANSIVIYSNPYGTGLKTDPELDALRGREDFKKLVAGLDAEAAARKK
jgi:hypothetical protein